MENLKHVPLDTLHRELGAKMGAFAGYDMPIQYPAGLKTEHLHTRSQAGLFDVSHMGQLRVTGPDLHRALERALPVDFDGWPVGLQRYSYLLNERGGIEDDLMLVNCPSEVRIVVNAGNRDADFALLQRLCPDLRFEWVDAALIALQGPAAEAVLARLDPKARAMTFMQSATLGLLGLKCFATRCGYTGEDGFEISLPLADGGVLAQAVARALLADPAVAPIGLGARDTLRLEAGLPLHGVDIGPDTTPVEAALGFAIAKSRRAGGAKAGGFPGGGVILRELEQGPSRKLVGLISDDAVPIRSHAAIVDAADRPAGEVTSGTVSPSLGKPVMLAYLGAALVPKPADRAQSPALRAVVRDKRPIVRLTALPFVPKRYKR